MLQVILNRFILFLIASKKYTCILKFSLKKECSHCMVIYQTILENGSKYEFVWRYVESWGKSVPISPEI